MKIIRDCLKEAYKNESREVQEEIEAERLAQNRCGDNSDNSSDETSNEDDESHGTVVKYGSVLTVTSTLDDLPTILQQVFAEIHCLTGWQFMVLGAGNLPGEEDHYESIV